MTRCNLRNRYFDWLCDLVCRQRYSKAISFRKLLTRLHETEFTYLIPRDKNRAMDGIDLRWRFSLEYNLDSGGLDGPCSVLEMMVALAIRCEEDYMDDPGVGDRTGQWFWGMIVNLGLGSMTDTRYDERVVDDILQRFLNREYEPDGKGGLFTVRNCNFDLRDVEIWVQMCYYLDNFM